MRGFSVHGWSLPEHPTHPLSLSLSQRYGMDAARRCVSLRKSRSWQGRNAKPFKAKLSRMAS